MRSSRKPSFAVFSLALLALSAAAGTPPPGDILQVNTSTLGDQLRPAVAMSPRGRIVIVWDRPNTSGTDRDVVARLYGRDGEPLGGEVLVNTYTTGEQTSPAVATARDGSFAVTWQSPQDGSGSGVVARLFDASGVAASGEIAVNTYTTGHQGAPTIALAVDASFVIFWEGFGQDGSGSSIFGQRFDALGMPLGEEFQANTQPAASQSLPKIGMTPTGNFVVVWEASDGATEEVRGRRFASNGQPSGSELVVDDFSSYFSEPKGHPQVAVDPSGEFVVAWRDRYYLAGTTTAATQIFDAAGQPRDVPFRPAFSIDINSVALFKHHAGDFTVSWARDYYPQVKGRRFDRFGALQESFVVNAGSYDFNRKAQNVAIDHRDGSNSFIVVWAEQPEVGSPFDIFARIYGPPLFDDGFESGDVSAWSASSGL